MRHAGLTRSIFDSRERQRLVDRIDVLKAGVPARWGRMNAHEMICHLADALDSSAGPSPEPGRGLFTRFPLKQLVIYWLPWPRGTLQSPPDLLATRPGSWNADVARLKGLLEDVARRDIHGRWPASEVFGPLSGQQWGALLRKHFDHHLTQFGV